jgi:hypothetical protein
MAQSMKVTSKSTCALSADNLNSKDNNPTSSNMMITIVLQQAAKMTQKNLRAALLSRTIVCTQKQIFFSVGPLRLAQQSTSSDDLPMFQSLLDFPYSTQGKLTKAPFSIYIVLPAALELSCQIEKKMKQVLVRRCARRSCVLN